MVYKRSILIIILTSLIIAGTSFAQNQDPDYETTKVADGVYRFRWQGHNTMFVVTPEGVVAFDPISVEAAKYFGQEIKKAAPGSPLVAVIYSHSDADHATGAKSLIETMSATRVQIIAHENALNPILEAADPELPLPTVLFKERLLINFGGRAIDLHYFGATHTNNLIIPMIPDAGVIFAVDFVNNDRVGYRELPSFIFPDWFSSVNGVLQLPFNTVIFGHGPMGDRGSILRQYLYYDDLRTSVLQAIADGKSEDEAAATIKLDEYSEWGQYEEWFPLNVRAMYRQTVKK